MAQWKELRTQEEDNHTLFMIVKMRNNLKANSKGLCDYYLGGTLMVW